MKTSQQHPLRIDAVEISATGGRIGMTICPGKFQRGAHSCDWDRDLTQDLQVIEAWGAAVIVNLIEDHEMVALQVEDTPQRVPAGIEYLRLPIPDFGVPDKQWENCWQSIGPVLQEHLRRGRAVLLHCKGGLGRTGLVAARILVELGFTADTAITTVREARAGAIETRAQEQYVKNLA